MSLKQRLAHILFVFFHDPAYIFHKKNSLDYVKFTIFNTHGKCDNCEYPILMQCICVNQSCNLEAVKASDETCLMAVQNKQYNNTPYNINSTFTLF